MAAAEAIPDSRLPDRHRRCRRMYGRRTAAPKPFRDRNIRDALPAWSRRGRDETSPVRSNPERAIECHSLSLLLRPFPGQLRFGEL